MRTLFNETERGALLAESNPDNAKVDRTLTFATNDVAAKFVMVLMAGDTHVERTAGEKVIRRILGKHLKKAFQEASAALKTAQ